MRTGRRPGLSWDAFSLCIKAKAHALVGSTESDEVVADRAVAACGEPRQALWLRIQKPPLGFAPDRASAEIDQAVEGIRPQILQAIRDER
jgi:hypothetical protein